MPTQHDGDVCEIAALARMQEDFQSKALGTSQLKPRFDDVPPQDTQAHYEKKGLPMMLCFQVYYYF